MDDIELLKKKILAIADGAAGPVIVGIDGGSCTGKTTFCKALAQELGCTLFHADDFFLRPEQRTPQRCSEPGGNMDRLRLRDEVILPLKAGKGAEYRPFSCHEGRLMPAVKPPFTRLNIIEGAYCLHPELWDFYDLHVFAFASEQTRRERLSAREGENASNFIKYWMPLENRYFDEFDIKSRADIIIGL